MAHTHIPPHEGATHIPMQPPHTHSHNKIILQHKGVYTDLFVYVCRTARFGPVQSATYVQHTNRNHGFVWGFDVNLGTQARLGWRDALNHGGMQDSHPERVACVLNRGCTWGFAEGPEGCFLNREEYGTHYQRAQIGDQSIDALVVAALAQGHHHP